MNKFILSSVLATLLLGVVAHAAEDSLPEQLHQIEALQRRADILAFGALGPDNYHLAKARTWLDLALSEYHENEANGIVPAAIAQIESLLDALEKKQSDISMETPAQVTGSEAVRPDLWKRIAALKSNKHFSCGQRSIAEAEVHLIWAGHEKFESSWANAQPYARSAEELIREALAAIEECTKTHASPMTAKLTLSSDAMFEFNDDKPDSSALWRLNRLVDSIKQATSLDEVILVGHTDRLRSDGKPERNQTLSERRAENIKRYLVSKGIPAEKVKASGVGPSKPLVKCSTRQSKARQIVCLKPNRRVEIILHMAN